MPETRGRWSRLLRDASRRRTERSSKTTSEMARIAQWTGWHRTADSWNRQPPRLPPPATTATAPGHRVSRGMMGPFRRPIERSMGPVGGLRAVVRLHQVVNDTTEATLRFPAGGFELIGVCPSKRELEYPADIRRQSRTPRHPQQAYLLIADLPLRLNFFSLPPSDSQVMKIPTPRIQHSTGPRAIPRHRGHDELAKGQQDDLGDHP